MNPLLEHVKEHKEAYLDLIRKIMITDIEELKKCLVEQNKTNLDNIGATLFILNIHYPHQVEAMLAYYIEKELLNEKDYSNQCVFTE